MFIRFNPDDYTKDGKKQTSSFKYHKASGVPIIRKSAECENRLSMLKEKIDCHIANIPDREVTTVQLFYDSETM